MSVLRAGGDLLTVRGLSRLEQGSPALLTLLGEHPGVAEDAGGHAEGGVGWEGLMRQGV